MEAKKVVCYEIPNKMGYKSLVIGPSNGDNGEDLKILIVDTRYQNAESYINIESKALMDALTKFMGNDD